MFRRCPFVVHYSYLVKQGTYDQSDHERFTKYFGRQCSGIAVAAACKATRINPKLWTRHTIDECVTAGDELFTKSINNILSKNPKFNHYYLKVEELYKEIEFPSGQKVKFDVNTDLSITGLLILSNETCFIENGPTNYSLKDGLNELFTNCNFGVLTCNAISICVMKVSDSFFVFDSHKRGENGLTDAINGKAVLIEFSNISDIVTYIQYLHNSCEFEITGLNIMLSNAIEQTSISTNSNEQTTNESSHTTVTHKEVNKGNWLHSQKRQKKQQFNFNNNKRCKPEIQIGKICDTYDVLDVQSTDRKTSRNQKINQNKKEYMKQFMNIKYHTNIKYNEKQKEKGRQKYQNDEIYQVKHKKHMRDQYQSDEIYQDKHKKHMRDNYHNDQTYHNNLQNNMKIKYHTNQTYHNKQKNTMKNKYHTDEIYHQKSMLRCMTKVSTDDGRKKKAKQDLENIRNKRNIANSKEHLIEQYKVAIQESPDKVCCCCAQLFFKKSLVNIEDCDLQFRLKYEKVCCYKLENNTTAYYICKTCYSYLKKDQIPHFAHINGLGFEPIPKVLEGLNSMEERLLCSFQLFMKIQELGYEKQFGLKGHCISVPCEIKKIITKLPRMNTEDDTIVVKLMRRMTDKNHYLCENVRPEKVFQAAIYLTQQEVYKQHGICLDQEWLDEYNKRVTGNCENLSIHSSENNTDDEDSDDEQRAIEAQETLLTSGFIADSGIKIAPAEGNTPVSILADDDLDVLAFPTVYAGKQRKFKVKYTPTQIAKVEARMHDRRVATNIPKLMFNFCKARVHKLRSRVSVAIRQNKNTDKLNVSDVLNDETLVNITEHNDGFRIVGTDRASPAFWEKKQKTPMAMLRQYGPATFFKTYTIGETKCYELLISLSKTVYNEDITEDEAREMTWQQKADLIKKDPVTCARYFDHRFAEFWKLAKARDGFYHKHKMLHWFWRYEIQFRGKANIGFQSLVSLVTTTYL